jgi:hypothetical protein
MALQHFLVYGLTQQRLLVSDAYDDADIAAVAYAKMEAKRTHSHYFRQGRTASPYLPA